MEEMGKIEGENQYKTLYSHAYDTSRKGTRIDNIYSGLCHPTVEEFASIPLLITRTS